MPPTDPANQRPSLRIKELAITNFRTFRERTEIPFHSDEGEADAIAVLHGDNGSGKSNALAALDLFFQTAVLSLRQTNDEADILLPWDLPHSLTGKPGDRPFVPAYRDRPYGSSDPMEIEVHFSDSRLGCLRSVCTPSGNQIRIQLLRAVETAEASTSRAFSPIPLNERDRLVTWLSTPMGPGTHPIKIVNARRRDQWSVMDANRSLMHPTLAHVLFTYRTSRIPDLRNVWRNFTRIIARFDSFREKDLSIERSAISDQLAIQPMIDEGGEFEVIVEDRGRTVLALNELSSGEQHIIVLCAASLVAVASILAIEEPEISLDFKNQRLLREILEQIVTAGVVDQIVLESHVPTFDGPDVIRFRRDESGATRVHRGPSRDEKAREMERRAKEQGAKQRWVTRDGYTQLPENMRGDLTLQDGGHVWFLKGPKHWEAWPEAEVDDLLRGGEHDGGGERDG